MNLFALLDTSEEIIEIAQQTDTTGAVILTVICATLLVASAYLICFQKNVSKNERVLIDTSHYVKTTAKITEVKKYEYKIVPFKMEQSIKEALAEEHNQSGSKKKNKSTDQGLVGILPRYAYDEKAIEKIDKVRYDVKYEFTASETGEVWKGSFSVYQKRDDIFKGNDIDVMYNPANPKANYTKFHSPIGKY